MRKLAAFQILLAVAALVGVAWIFFHVRPKINDTQQLQSKVATLSQREQVLQTKVNQTTCDHKQARAYSRQGIALFREKNISGALGMYDKALQSCPNDAYATGLKGYALYRNGQIAESVTVIEQAVQLYPGDPLNYIDLAKAECAAKDWDAAVHAVQDEPPSGEVKVSVLAAVKSDGELQRVCRPVLARLAAAPSD